MTTPWRLSCAYLVFVCVAGAHLLAQVTESPHTLPPGKLLLEIDGLKLTYDRADAAGNKFTGVAVASTILSAGLTQSVDLQVGADLFVKQTFTTRGLRDSHSGRGDLFFRSKWTFWRDEQRGAALAVIPYVKIPANTGGVGNDSIEGGFFLPWAMNLGGGVMAGAQFQWDHIRNPDDNGYDARWNLSGFIQRNLTRSFAVYGELTTNFFSTGFSDWMGAVGIGALFQVTQSTQLDYELQRGLNAQSHDWTHVFRVNWEW